jgi:uncharacterized protein YqjF (DUF2071 family)
MSPQPRRADLAIDRSAFDPALDHVGHRPWALPRAPWVGRQTWVDVLFAHWPMAPAALRPLVPGEFELDYYDATAWLGIVAFQMRDVAPRGLPALPWLSAFPELNVRTYVRAGGKSGVYFFSLDAGRTLAVLAARLGFNLPYFRASMQVTTGRQITYRSQRRGAAAAFTAVYGPAGDTASEPLPGTIEHFLTERYCLFNLDHRNRPYRLDIHHRPWRLHSAHAEIERNTVATVQRLALPSVPATLHFAERQDMVMWLPRRIGSGS